MIVTRLTGGLGNQMFQYAAGKRLALHRKTSLKLDLSAFDNQPPNETPRHFELDCFKTRAEIAANIELPADNVANKLSRKLGLSKSLKVFGERSFSFDPEVLKAPDNTWLTGFWQSPKYFEDEAETIRKDFSFAVPLSGKNAEVARMITEVSGISLHVRRADYAHDSATNKFHGMPTIADYYLPAIKMISDRVKSPHFFVFSDDIPWCKDNLKLQNPTAFVDHNGPGKGYEDMRLMSLCTNHIIANSSFSWWGAWLNDRPDKIVLAPERWFSDPGIDTSDLIPENWFRL